jgi:chorismate mutase
LKSTTPEQELLQLRAEVDAIDTHILQLLKKRTELACAMGLLKKSIGRNLQDSAREAAILTRVKEENGTNTPVLREEFLLPIYKQIMALALDAQCKI